MNAIERDAAIRGIRELIAEKEKAVQELPILRQALAMFEAQAANDASRQLSLPKVSDAGLNGSALTGDVEIDHTFAPRSIRIAKDSLGSHALKILEAAGKPMTVKEIMAELRVRGKTNSEATLVSVLCWYNNKGVVQRTAASTYTVPVFENSKTVLQQNV